jgi:hypothetical protein
MNAAAFLNQPGLKYVPLSERRTWEPYLGRLRLAEAPLRRRYWEARQRVVGPMRRAGVRILCGTDLGNAYIYPGFSVHDELRLLVEAGLSPLEALQACTVNPAEFLNVADSLGTVQTGKLADLVLLDADPLADIRNTARIRAVVLNGRLLTRSDLDGLLAAGRGDRDLRRSGFFRNKSHALPRR